MRRALSIYAKEQSEQQQTSFDGFNKPNPKSRRETGKRNRGGQKGHSGTTLKRVVAPDHIVNHIASNCGQCGGTLKRAKEISHEARLVPCGKHEKLIDKCRLSIKFS